MGLAVAVDMEPGMRFVESPGGPVLTFAGVEAVTSRFPGKRRVRVLVSGEGRSFVADRDRKFLLIGGV